MNTNEILVSMARYIHAVYDIEIDAEDPNLNITTKKYVEKLGKKDETLSSYWDSYISTLTGKVIVKEPYKETKEQGVETTTSTYRGVETEVSKESKQQSNKTEILYRGQTL